mmetsp:Transcript_55843/g.99420  ORF Transcript_55843/g.99420 Transcript_55843/m.99420 type:complete len:207 (-) Transcript_55843:281-901(-)
MEREGVMRSLARASASMSVKRLSFRYRVRDCSLGNAWREARATAPPGPRLVLDRPRDKETSPWALCKVANVFPASGPKLFSPINTLRLRSFSQVLKGPMARISSGCSPLLLRESERLWREHNSFRVNTACSPPSWSGLLLRKTFKVLSEWLSRTKARATAPFGSSRTLLRYKVRVCSWGASRIDARTSAQVTSRKQLFRKIVRELS